MAPVGRHALVVVEHPYRGITERVYADSFYLVRVLAAQLGAVDVVLRGEAVLLAAAHRSTTHQGTPGWDATLPHVLKEGSAVYADLADLERFGLAPDGLLDGVRALPAEDLPAWPGYDHVWFL